MSLLLDAKLHYITSDVSKLPGTNMIMFSFPSPIIVLGSPAHDQLLDFCSTEAFWSQYIFISFTLNAVEHLFTWFRPI